MQLNKKSTGTLGDQFGSLREIGKVSEQGLFIYDLQESKIVYSNDVGQKLTGMSASSFSVGKGALLAILALDDQEYVKSEYAKFAEKDGMVEIEFRLQDGATTVCCTAHLIFDKTVIVLFVKDITKAKQHEDYLVEFGTKKNTLLDTAMHHFSGALVLMQHLSAEAERSIDTGDIKNQKIFLRLLSDNSRHGAQIIQDLLSDEHSRAPFVSVKTTRLDVVKKIAFIYQNLKDSYRDRIFALNSSRAAIYVRADEFKLLQIVNNFISNALKFTPGANEIAFNVHEAASEIIVSVSDEGIGIPEQLKPFVFDQRSIAGRVGLRGEESTGLGLFISKKLVEVMQGRIWFESIEGEGSTFYFALPKH
jgi:two-component system sensor histidine kinase VicK